MRILGGLVLAAGLSAAAMAQHDDPNYRTPQIFTVEQGEMQAHFIIGDMAWGDVTATLAALRENGPENDAAIIQQLWDARDQNAPVFLFEVSRRAAQSDPQLAIEAYFLGRSRSIYDAARCIDSTAFGVVDLATQYAGEDVVALMQERLGDLPVIVDRIVEEGSAFNGQASPWWACSFGESAYIAAINDAPMTGPEWLKVEANWPGIRLDVENNLRSNAARLRQVLAALDAETE